MGNRTARPAPSVLVYLDLARMRAALARDIDAFLVSPIGDNDTQKTTPILCLHNDVMLASVGSEAMMAQGERGHDRSCK